MGSLKRSVCSFAALICFSGAGASLLHAQGTGSIKGMVTDVTAKAIPQAVVTIKNEASGNPKQATADSTGKFSFDNLADGSYTVDASAPSFSASRRTGVK